MVIAIAGSVVSVVASGCACPLINLASTKAVRILKAKLPPFKDKKNQEIFTNFQNQVKKFHRMLLIVENILKSTREPGENDAGMQYWLLTVNDSVFRAVVLSENLSCATLQTCQILTEDIESFLTDMSALIEEHKAFQVRESLGYVGNEGDGESLLFQHNESSSIIHEHRIFGRTEVMDSLLDIIVAHSGRNLSVISIYGEAGVGKTTLARLIYNAKITIDFPIKIWISMHAEFSLKSVIRAMIENITREKCDLFGLNVLQDKLGGLLVDTKFLIVLDGAWHEKLIDWTILFACLQVGAVGSTILVSTESTIVTTQIRCTHQHHLKPLSDEECWSILKTEAFHGDDGRIDDELQKIGLKLAKKCYGMPLVASTFGRFLYLNDNHRDWEYLLRTEIHCLPNGNDIFWALLLSHSHLPGHLRMLFAYIAVYPYNHIFKRDELIRLWIAEGFINPTKGMCLEEQAYTFFDDLHRRSFFTLVPKDPESMDEFYTVIGLRYHMAQLVFYDESFRAMVVEKSDLEDKNFGLVRQITLCVSIPLSEILGFKELRTLLVVAVEPQISMLPVDFWKELNNIIVLDFSNCAIVQMSEGISNLKFLRYLNLSSNPIFELPSDLPQLGILETLNLRNCKALSNLPEDFGKLTKLRHLDIDDNPKFVLPHGIQDLVHLQVLTFAIIGKTPRNIKELRNLIGLRILHISGLEKVDNTEAKDADMGRKENLEKLTLQWFGPGDPQVNQSAPSAASTSAASASAASAASASGASQKDKVIENLQPHPNLKHLVIQGSQHLTVPKWNWHSFSALTHIELKDCHQLKSVKELMELPCLRKIELIGNKRIDELDVTFFGNHEVGKKFLKLEELRLHNWTKLNTWLASPLAPEYALLFSKLTVITISSCHALKSINISMPSSVCDFYIKDAPKLQNLDTLKKNHPFVSFHGALTHHCTSPFSFFNVIFFRDLTTDIETVEKKIIVGMHTSIASGSQ